MEVFHCEDSVYRMPRYNGPCRAENVPAVVKACSRVLAAWAMGAEPFYYPSEAGIPFGGPGYYRYVKIETHYNNPQNIAGIKDSSGMRIYYTPTLRQFDAGILEAGLVYTANMAIPPGQTSFPVTGYCTPDCTDAGLPADGITIFASQLHAHNVGRRLNTVLVREGEEIDIVNEDRHFTTHWQEIRTLESPVQVYPGDSLSTTCDYDTSEKRNVTLGGAGINDEMCVNYIHYYPLAKVEVCKSAIDPVELSKYFDSISRTEHANSSLERHNFRLEHQPTNGERSAEENYKSIKWSLLQTLQLAGLYRRAPLKMECLRHDGKPLPGNWDGIPIPKVKLGLEDAPRNC